MRLSFARTTLYPAMILSTLLLGACGGGGDDPPATNNPPSTQTDPPPASPAPPALAAGYTELEAGAINSPQGWPAWTNNGQAVEGVVCLTNINYHIHALVSIYKDGVRQGLPGNIGRSGCTYELHTHDVTGIVHIEANAPKKFTLGQFFALWRQPLLASGTAGLPGPIRYYIIDREVLTPYTGNPADVELTAHREIVIVSGTPPATLPRYRWPSEL